MRLRAFLLVPALAAAVLAVGASGASGATLFTSAAHTTRVTVGATATATLTSPVLDWTFASVRFNACTHSTLHFSLAQNNHTAVVANVVSGAFGPCVSPITGNFATPWKLTVTGTGTMVGAFTRWSAAIDSFSFNQLGGSYSGNLTTGVTATQPTTAAAPICIHLANAAGFSGPLTGDGRIDASYCFSGTSAAFSLTN